jgi:hypothetical protein
MLNWFELMRQAQGGAGLDNMARYFGLTPEQTTAAVAALLPAFAIGLQHNAANPNATAQFFKLMTGGPYPSFWDSATQAFTPQARQEGHRLLDQLFGSDEVCRRVAHQAAAFSGVGVDVLQQMLPLVAGIVAGGIYKIAVGQAEVLASFGQMPRTQSTGEPSAGLGPWAELWSSWMTGTQRPAAPDQEAPAATARERTRADAPKPAPEPEKPPAQNPFEAWSELVETGQEMQAQHLEALQNIFDGVWGRAPRKP